MKAELKQNSERVSTHCRELSDGWSRERSSKTKMFDVFVPLCQRQQATLLLTLPVVETLVLVVLGRPGARRPRRHQPLRRAPRKATRAQSMSRAGRK